MVCRKLVSLAVKRWCEEQKYCSKKLSALCQHTAPETVPRLTWNYQEAGKFLEGQKRRICEAGSFFSNFTLKLLLVTQIFHPNLVTLFKRNKLRKCFISIVGSSRDGLTSPHQSCNPIHLEDVWRCHRACSIHLEPRFFVLHR